MKKFLILRSIVNVHTNQGILSESKNQFAWIRLAELTDNGLEFTKESKNVAI